MLFINISIANCQKTAPKSPLPSTFELPRNKGHRNLGTWIRNRSCRTCNPPTPTSPRTSSSSVFELRTIANLKSTFRLPWKCFTIWFHGRLRFSFSLISSSSSEGRKWLACADDFLSLGRVAYSAFFKLCSYVEAIVDIRGQEGCLSSSKVH